MIRMIAVLFPLLLIPFNSAMANVVYSLDFSSMPDGDAHSWFDEQGYVSRKDAKEMISEFRAGKLRIATDEPLLGIFYKEIDIEGAAKVRIEWGVNRFPEGADWENGVFREAISVVISFGHKKIDSGSFFVPNIPYFIGLFIGEKDIAGKPYIGNIYKKGGRWFCAACGAKAGDTIITEFPLTDAFQRVFGVKEVPAISSISIEADTRGTEGQSEAFIKRIEFLRN